MIVKDVPIGSVFNIENTPTYPKLKLKESYVDMRDEIIGTPSITDDKEAYLMSAVDVGWQFGETTERAQEWIDEIKEKYLKHE